MVMGTCCSGKCSTCSPVSSAESTAGTTGLYVVDSVGCIKARDAAYTIACPAWTDIASDLDNSSDIETSRESSSNSSSGASWAVASAE